MVVDNGARIGDMSHIDLDGMPEPTNGTCMCFTNNPQIIDEKLGDKYWQSVRNDLIWITCGDDTPAHKIGAGIGLIDPLTYIGWLINDLGNDSISHFIGPSREIAKITQKLTQEKIDAEVEIIPKLRLPSIETPSLIPILRYAWDLECAIHGHIVKYDNPAIDESLITASSYLPQWNLLLFRNKICLDTCWDEFWFAMALAGMENAFNKQKDKNACLLAYVSAGVYLAQMKMVPQLIIQYIDRFCTTEDAGLREDLNVELQKWKNAKEPKLFYPSYKVPLGISHFIWKKKPLHQDKLQEYLNSLWMYLRYAIDIYGDLAPLVQESSLILLDNPQAILEKYDDELDRLNTSAARQPTRELFCRLGRYYKNKGDQSLADSRCVDDSVKNHYIAARKNYLRALELPCHDDYYPAVNVTTLNFIMHNPTSAAKYREVTIKSCESLVGTNDHHPWDLLSWAESLITSNDPNELEQALDKYNTAIENAAGIEPGIAQSAYYQLCRIFEASDVNGRKHIALVAEAFLKRFPGLKGILGNCGIETIERRLWPAYNDRVNWFQSTAGPITHNYSDLTIVQMPAYQDQVRAYLSGLCGNNVAKWVDQDNGNGKIKKLIHNALKHLIGYCACADSGKDRNLTLFGAMLLLGAVCKDAGRPDALSDDGFRHIPHDFNDCVILPRQAKEQATKTIISLYAMFKRLCISTAGANKGEFILKTAGLEGNMLRAEFAFDGARLAENLNISSSSHHDSTKAVRDFELNAGISVDIHDQALPERKPLMVIQVRRRAITQRNLCELQILSLGDVIDT